MPIRALFGPAPYKELIKGQVVETFDAGVTEIVEPLVFKRLVQVAP